MISFSHTVFVGDRFAVRFVGQGRIADFERALIEELLASIAARGVLATAIRDRRQCRASQPAVPESNHWFEARTVYAVPAGKQQASCAKRAPRTRRRPGTARGVTTNCPAEARRIDKSRVSFSTAGLSMLPNVLSAGVALVGGRLGLGSISSAHSGAVPTIQ